MAGQSPWVSYGELVAPDAAGPSGIHRAKRKAATICVAGVGSPVFAAVWPITSTAVGFRGARAGVSDSCDRAKWSRSGASARDSEPGPIGWGASAPVALRLQSRDWRPRRRGCGDAYETPGGHLGATGSDLRDSAPAVLERVPDLETHLILSAPASAPSEDGLTAKYRRWRPACMTIGNVRRPSGPSDVRMSSLPC